METVYILIFILLSIFIGLWLYAWYSFNYWQRQGVEVTDLPSFPLGHYWNLLWTNTTIGHNYYKFYKKTKGPFSGLYFGNHLALLVKDPELLKNILVKDFNYFMDRGINCEEKKEPLSAHLFRLQGKSWRDMRTKLTPAFTVAKIKGMGETINVIGQICEDNLKDNAMIDISDLALKFTCDCFAPIVFGVEINSFENEENYIWKALQTIVEDVPYRRYLVFMLSQFAPIILNIFQMGTIFNKSNLEVFEVVKDVVYYREKNNIIRNDYMQLLLQLKNPQTGEKNNGISDENHNVPQGMPIERVSACVYTMFFAGVDTIANTITYALHLLAFHPEIQNKVLEDIDRALNKHNGQITYESVADMGYLDMVIQETLRMFPVLAFLSRRVTQDYRIPNSNIKLKQGMSVLVSLLGMHYDPIYFPNPNQFDPERFSPENKANIQPYTYLPFGDGPRNCIGKKLALQLCALGLVWSLKNYRVEPCEKSVKTEDFKFRAYYFTHVTTDHLFVKFIQRKQSK